MRLFHAALLVALGAAPALQAQVTFDVQASLAVANDSLKKVTHGSTLGGATLGVGLNTQVWGSDVPLRAFLNVGTFPGKDFGTVKTSLSMVQVGTELYVRTPAEHLNIVAGVTLSKFQVKNAGYPSQPTTDIKNSAVTYNYYDWAVAKGDGGKFGARLGFDYTLTRKLRAHVVLQMSELGTGPFGSVNPSWMDIGVRYTF